MDDTKDTPKQQINYELIVEEALRAVVRTSLRLVEEQGFHSDNHFYITFMTNIAGVVMSEDLRKKHPERMTIVIQHQYWDLKVEDTHFSVTLTFSGQRETLIIPFIAVADFNDPAVGFGLEFAHENAIADAITDNDEIILDENLDKILSGEPTSAEVVSLDAFRKKN